MERFDTILWDVDQTLLDFNKSQEYALCRSFEQYGRKTEDGLAALPLYKEINDSYWKRYELGEVTKSELLTGRFDTLFLQIGITDIDSGDFAAFYQEALGSVFYFKDDSFNLCGKLKGKVRQYAVTNGVSSTQRNKLNLSGLSQLLDDIFVSEEMGYPKPDIRYFEKCFQQIPGFKKEKTLLIGDSLTSDIQGANNTGIACCWYNPEGKKNSAGLKIDYEIQNLWEVEDILSWQNPPIKK